MLETFPALKKLEDHTDIWADLQFREAEAVIGTMLILMRAAPRPKPLDARRDHCAEVEGRPSQGRPHAGVSSCGRRRADVDRGA